MAKVLFEGTKTFWKTKNSIRLTVIEHRLHDVLEVVAYEPAIQVEAPRLYLDIELIVSLLDLERALLSSSDTAFADAVSKFVFNRISIARFLPVSRIFEVELQRGYGTKEQSSDLQLSVDRPPSLVPHFDGLAG
jgi:hypothetical protein